MNEILLNTIFNDMNKYLNNYQLEKLKDVLKYNLFVLNENNYKVEIDYLDKFFSVKLLEGCSNETIKNYRLVLTRFLNDINKQVKPITTDDIRNYLIEYQLNNNVSKASLDNKRRIISSFFTFLEVEEYIVKKPCRKIKKIKVDKTVKETYSEETLECMREQCKNKRDLAIIDFLSSTGIRVGEMFKLNRDDIKFEDKSCIVFGKGSKEREVYFSGKAKVPLKEYLDSRNDNNVRISHGRYIC